MARIFLVLVPLALVTLHATCVMGTAQAVESSDTTAASADCMVAMLSRAGVSAARAVQYSLLFARFNMNTENMRGMSVFALQIIGVNSTSDRRQISDCFSSFTGATKDPSSVCAPSRVCSSHGNCSLNSSETLPNYACKCEVGYSGPNCEYDACMVYDDQQQPLPHQPLCQHGGTCTRIAEDPSYSCLCRHGYTGVQCQDEIDHCQGDPCANGGRCENRDGQYVCHCSADYTGPRCMEKRDLQRDIRQLSDLVKDLTTAVSQLDGKVSGLESKVNNIESKVIGIEDTVTKFEEKTNGVEAKVTLAIMKLGRLETTVTAASAGVGRVEARTDGLRARSNEMQVAISRIEVAVQAPVPASPGAGTGHGSITQSGSGDAQRSLLLDVLSKTSLLKHQLATLHTQVNTVGQTANRIEKNDILADHRLERSISSVLTRVNTFQCPAVSVAQVPDSPLQLHLYWSSMTWAGAKQFCASRGEVLGSILNAADNDFAFSAAERMVGTGCVWTGGNDKENEGTWLWPNRQPFWRAGQPITGMFHFFPGVPDNSRNEEHCLSLSFHPGHRAWNDLECNRRCNVLCRPA